LDTATNPPVVGIACSILKKELECLCKKGELALPIRPLPSMLHMRPKILECQLLPSIEKQLNKGRKIVLIYGDCCPGMREMEANPNIGRTKGSNCCEIILGSEIYRKMISEGVFFFMPEWTLRWKEVFREELGLTGEMAKSFMNDMHTKLVYLDTGIIPPPLTELKDVSKYAGLPWETMTVSLDNLRESVLEVMHRLKAADAQT